MPIEDAFAALAQLKLDFKAAFAAAGKSTEGIPFTGYPSLIATVQPINLWPTWPAEGATWPTGGRWPAEHTVTPGGTGPRSFDDSFDDSFG